MTKLKLFWTSVSSAIAFIFGGMDKMLARATKWVALAWLVLTLTLSLLP